MYPASKIDELRLGKIKPFLSVTSAIDKYQVESSFISRLGLSGDEQADQIHHGGEDRAVLQYDSRHYQQLKTAFPNSRHLFINGSFGENFVVSGMNEHNTCIGDIVTVGSAVLQVAQPRQPCFKLNYAFNEARISRFTQNNYKTGWLYRVLEAGIVKKGDTIKVTERPYPQCTIAKVQHCLYHETNNIESAKQLSSLEPLASGIKAIFQRRIESNHVEDWEQRLSGEDAQFENVSVAENENRPFEVTIKETGQKITVPANTTMLNALRKNGLIVNSGCETGLCGKCKINYDGDVEHQDSILSNRERERYMTPCVSWAKSEKLTISLS